MKIFDFLKEKNRTLPRGCEMHELYIDFNAETTMCRNKIVVIDKNNQEIKLK